MDEAGGSVMRDLSGSGLDGAIGSAVVVGGGTYRFPGWSPPAPRESQSPAARHSKDG